MESCKHLDNPYNPNLVATDDIERGRKEDTWDLPDTEGRRAQVVVVEGEEISRRANPMENNGPALAA
jgi:hypothetical protein